jgi:hypothetical protein
MKDSIFWIKNMLTLPMSINVNRRLKHLLLIKAYVFMKFNTIRDQRLIAEIKNQFHLKSKQSN